MPRCWVRYSAYGVSACSSRQKGRALWGFFIVLGGIIVGQAIYLPVVLLCFFHAGG